MLDEIGILVSRNEFQQVEQQIRDFDMARIPRGPSGKPLERLVRLFWRNVLGKVLLKRYKNSLFEKIQTDGFDVFDFAAHEESCPDGPLFVIRYQPANLTFMVLQNPHSAHEFALSYDVYASGLEQLQPTFQPDTGYTDFRIVLKALDAWLGNEVKTAIDEELLPDLWTMTRDHAATSSEANLERFSDAERDQIKLGLATFRVLIIQNFDPDPGQLEAVSQRLDYLSAAVDRLNKFDWKGVALSTLIGISTTLTLDTDKGRQLYGLFQQALSSLMHLLR